MSSPVAAARRAPHKYAAKRTEYGGHVYQSKLEAEYARHLDLLKAAGRIGDWGRPAPMTLIPGTVRERVTYQPDFWVTPSQAGVNGMYYVETKGVMTEAAKLKLKLLKFRFPSIKLVVVRADGSEEWL